MKLKLADIFLSRHLVRAAPFVLGPIVSPTSLHSELLGGYVRAYLLFLLMFVFWNLLRWIVRSEQGLRAAQTGKKKPQELPRGMRIRNYLVITVISLFFLASLKPFETLFGSENFYVALAAMISAALADHLQVRRRFIPATLLRCAYYGGVGFLSFEPGLPPSWWQPALMSAGLAFMAAAQEIPAFLEVLSGELATRKPEKRTASPEGMAFRRLSQLLVMLFMAGPFAIAALVYAGQAHRSFLLIFLTLTISVRLFTALQQAEKTAEISPTIAREATGTSLLFVVIIGILTSIY